MEAVVLSLSFTAGINQLRQLTSSLIIVTGAGRSGKTTLGNILGSCENVEHIDEPWFPMMLPILANSGELSKECAIELFLTSIVETIYDRYLMRHVNFRPHDLSSVWKQKSVPEILDRLIRLKSRDDVREYAKEHRPVVVLTLTDCVPYYDFFWEAYPECRIVHMVREGLNVALEFSQKRWLSDKEHTNPVEAVPRKQYVDAISGTLYYLPHWLKDTEEQRYLSSSELARGLHYWRRIMQMSEIGSPTSNWDSMITLKLEPMLMTPRPTVYQLIDLLGMIKTDLTETLINNVHEDLLPEMPSLPINYLEAEEMREVRAFYSQFNMPTTKLDNLLGNVR